MKKTTALIIAFSMFGTLYADDHKKEKKEHPNKLMSAKECMETKDAIGWFLESAHTSFHKTFKKPAWAGNVQNGFCQRILAEEIPGRPE